MHQPQLVIKAKCRDCAEGPCLFKGENLWIDITISNADREEILIPFDYLQKSGPAVRLINTKDHAETSLKGNLADPALKAKLLPLAPGASASIEWLIYPGELEHFGKMVDLSAEFGFATDVYLHSIATPFDGSDTIRIISQKKR